MFFLRIILGFIFIFLSALSYGKLTNIEQDIVQNVQSSKNEQLELLEKLVNINSGTTNLPGVHAVGEVLEPLFSKLGFKTHWVESPASMHRAPTLIAEHPGSEGKHLLLIGHLDTVFPTNSNFKLFKREKEHAIGPGVVDDKGGDVVILYALEALNKSKALANKQITVVLTGDEEDSGKPTSISRKPLFEAAKNSDIALDFECAITQDTATISRRGISMWLLKTQGIEAHSAEIFKSKVGYGAIYELSRILSAFSKQFSEDKTISLNPGLVLGGTKIDFDMQNSNGSVSGKENIIANTAIASGDLRFISEKQEEALSKKMQDIVKKHLPKTTAKLSFQKGIPAMPPTPANLKLLELYSSLSEDLGFGKVKPLPAHLRGAGDISHIASIVSANLAGLGPLGEKTHSIGESLDIPSLTMQTERAAIFIYRLSNNQ